MNSLSNYNTGYRAVLVSGVIFEAEPHESCAFVICSLCYSSAMLKTSLSTLHAFPRL